MSDSILDSVALTYQPVWDAQRRLAAVRLGVCVVQPEAVDGAHLMQALGEVWPAAAPALSLCCDSAHLRAQVLASEPVPNTWTEVPAPSFATPQGLAALSDAVQRGHAVLRVASLPDVCGEQTAPLGVRSLFRLTAEDALAALRARPVNGAVRPGPPSPIVPGQLYEGIAGRALAEHCLDEALAWGLAGWPDDDVMHSWRQTPLTGSASVIREAQQAIAQDASLEQLERHLRQDPVLVYRLLIYANSPAFGLAHDIESLRHAIMMLGFTALNGWLGQQTAGSAIDPALHPVRFAHVMRARLAQHLLEGGAAEALRAEVYLTALFSQLDRLLHQPLAPLLQKLPLSGRLLDAVLRQQGPYHPLLDIARAQGDFGHSQALPQACQQHGVALDHANRSLLRMIATTRDQTLPPRDHPWSQARQ